MSSLAADLLIMTGFTKLQDTGDTAHMFRQEPNFWYLTGIEYPDWQLVVDDRQDKTWLIAPDVDAIHQLFDGGLHFDEAKKISGVDEVVTRTEGVALIESLSEKHDVVHTMGAPSYAEYVDFSLNPAPDLLRRKLKRQFKEVKDCQEGLSRLRAIKKPEEITAIKNATRISMAALEKTAARIASCRHEYEIEAELVYAFRRQNAEHAFDPIVASGKNACTLHYTANDSILQKDNLLLIDIGARHQYYSGDITRTFATGDLTERQKAVHGTVQNALQEISLLLRPGLPTKRYAAAADEIMRSALLSLGLMKDKKDTDRFRKYFPHAISHGLGLDVHESLGGYKEFMPGMVVTVEPGIYIPEEEIGVRIEDDIVITENGTKNMTAGLSTDL